jgi:TetR/AcrR family transcriptional regulator, tetracycline repressor protein
VAVTRNEIVTAALALLDEAGLDGLTLRRLADRLGIRAPTLYWHVRDKRELLDLVASAIMDQALAGWREPRPGQAWWDWLAGRARVMRSALLAHRDSAMILAGNRPTGQALPGIERQLQALTGAGFSPPDAMLTLQALNAYVIGEVLDTQGEAARPAPAHAPSRAEGPAPVPVPSQAAGPAPVGAAFPLISAAMAALEPFGSSDQRFEHGLALIITGLRQRRDGAGPDGPTPRK